MFMYFVPLLIFLGIFAIVKSRIVRKTSGNPVYDPARYGLEVLLNDDVDINHVEKVVLSLPYYGDVSMPNALRVQYVLKDGTQKNVTVNRADDLFEARQKLKVKYEAKGIPVEISSAGAPAENETATPHEKKFRNTQLLIRVFSLLIVLSMLISTPDAQWRGGESLNSTHKVVQFVVLSLFAVVLIFGLIKALRNGRSVAHGTGPTPSIEQPTKDSWDN